MSWGVKNICFEAPGVSLGGSGVSIGGVRILRVLNILTLAARAYVCARLSANRKGAIFTERLGISNP